MQVDYTIVQAPFTGVVIDKAGQVGEMISPIFGGGAFEAAGIATIVDMGSLEVDVDVKRGLHPPGEARPTRVAVLDAYPDWNIPAHVIAIVPTADKSKATVKVRVAFEKLEPRILPDMGVRVSFLQGHRHNPVSAAAALPAGTVWVPASAVVQRAGARSYSWSRETRRTPHPSRLARAPAVFAPCRVSPAARPSCNRLPRASTMARASR